MISSVISLLLLALIVSCEKKEGMEPKELTMSDHEIASFQNASLDLYLTSVKDHADENFVISPLSIQFALYMAWNGAEGSTKKEIQSLLNLDDVEKEKVNERIAQLMNYYNTLVRDGHLDIHNGVFYDSDRIDINERFVDDIQKYFGGEVDELDFSNEKAASDINDWVKNITRGRIPEVLKEISDQELLFLLNVLYLKADWQDPFPVESTTDRPFYPEEGREILIPTMFRTGMVESYTDPSLQMIRLALADSALYVYYISPGDGGSGSDFSESDLLKRIWKEEFDFQSQRIMLSLPVVETRTHLILNPVLQNLGMKTSFDPQNAEFNGMGKAKTERPLFLSRALHDAYIKMDEKGVEGAAVTTIGIGTTSAPPSVVFNRPFLYLVMDRELNLPLFIGQFTGQESEE